jgi:nucleotide-binding universal stress UspA family protein
VIREDQDAEFGASGEPPAPPKGSGRTFLCVVDETEELHQALRYACRRAKATSGRVALLYVIEPVEYQHWMAVGHLMAEERREQAEEMLQVVSSVVQKLSGTTPVIFIREGKLTEQLMHLIESEADLSVLVLGAAARSEQAGQVISHVLKRVGKLPIPVTIVPGGLTDEQIDAIS